jgi:hypothetical protein
MRRAFCPDYSFSLLRKPIQGSMSMFFISPNVPNAVDKVPVSPLQNATSTNNKRKQAEAFSVLDDINGYYPKRNQRACDRCRLRKSRCSGGSTSERCRTDGIIRTTTSRKKDPRPPSAAYVQMVESQRDRLAQILQKISQIPNPSKAELDEILDELQMPSSQHRTCNETFSKDFLEIPANIHRECISSNTSLFDPGSLHHDFSEELTEELAQMNAWLETWAGPESSPVQ